MTDEEILVLRTWANRGKWLIANSVHTYDDTEGDRPQLVCHNIHTADVIDKYIRHDVALNWFQPF